MPVLPDGNYDVVVVDAEADEKNFLRVELVVTLGPYVGHVVSIRAPGRIPGSGKAGEGLLGLAGTLRVRAGEPDFRPELLT
jgi:hypothetical protein